MNESGTERCRCGQCDYYWLTGIGSFCQGSGFEKEEAEAIADLLNNEKKYKLLEMTSTTKRLRRLRKILTGAADQMEASAEIHEISRGNGHSNKKLDL